ncbi:MAG: hypothetical protein A2Z83_08470 [Omnitrophica bacterium GWA2_52_8]|nr:MAG: hypothetical protein A2Z83_08470 [Omnitrophica bacterium GWA2_52_8]
MPDKIEGSMSVEAALELDKTMKLGVGAHSATHPFLTQLPDEALEKELRESKESLEQMFQRPVFAVAYPFGHFDERVIRATKDAGYELAFTTGFARLNGQKETRYSLTRVKVSRSSKYAIVFWGEVSGVYTLFKTTVERIRRPFKRFEDETDPKAAEYPNYLYSNKLE